MPRSPQVKKRKRASEKVVEIQTRENCAIYIPSSNSGDSSSESGSESEGCSSDILKIPNVSYRQVLDNYEENQSKLEPHHTYTWIEGEKKRKEEFKNECLLSDSTKTYLRSLSSVQLFELFFSFDLKRYILESTECNGYSFTANQLDVFLGIVLTSIFSERKSERDYWSSNELLKCIPIASAMSRDAFLEIKRNIKLYKPKDKNDNDKAWKVRNILDIFKKNAAQFGFSSTALSIDEMMVKFHGRAPILQFMPNKPVRFGLKMWAICNVDGYLFDCDIYCGKGTNIYSTSNEMKLSKCAVGSRVVMLMVQKILTSVSLRKINMYHIYFDNYFSSPDLFVHLKNIGLVATGTVRHDRVKVKNILPKKAERGAYIVQHEENSGMNFITFMDSKPVSFLSTATGVTPLHKIRRFSVQNRSKVDLLVPKIVKQYNDFMGGVDQHDAHCSNLFPTIRRRNWTWSVLLRLIQSSITNATVLRNLVHANKVGTKQIALEIAECYLAKYKLKNIHV
ncbi:piggyBac transposable element-derived protein 3-like [Prorops nasuta]|uniref:piggyBac transposable element-derived protein 3-like n=1 Tax=Prorops nasuta TaxID=863751 RepID=UPI0034CF44F7